MLKSKILLQRTREEGQSTAMDWVVLAACAAQSRLFSAYPATANEGAAMIRFAMTTVATGLIMSNFDSVYATRKETCVRLGPR
jgi:hypothetical protein